MNSFFSTHSFFLLLVNSGFFPVDSFEKKDPPPPFHPRGKKRGGGGGKGGGMLVYIYSCVFFATGLALTEREKKRERGDPILLNSTISIPSFD